MTTTTAYKTIEILCTLFAAYGTPKEIVSDNGPPFSSREFESFCSRNGIKHTRVPPYHPSSNGAAERSVQIVKRALTKQMLENDPQNRGMSVQMRLANFLFVYRNTPNTTTTQTPAELFLKRKPRTKFSLLKPNLRDVVQDTQTKQKENHDKQGLKLRKVKVNDKVRVRNTRKGKIRWLLGRVTKICGPQSYIVRLDSYGTSRFVHIGHLLSWS